MNESEPVLRVVPMPRDVNVSGDVFGGWMMSQADIAGSILAFRRAQGRVATVAVSRFEFHNPVFVGDLVSFYARIAKVGRTSVTVDLEMRVDRRSRGEPYREEQVTAGTATLVYVAIAADRSPRPVPPEAPV